MTEQPDVAGAVLALDQAMIALAVAKSTLLGETSMPLAPYGSAKHGVFGGSAAEVAEGVESLHQWRPAPTGHLPQHTHGEPGCTYCGKDHAAVTR